MKKHCTAILVIQGVPTDAIRTFFSPGVDSIMIGGGLVEK
jgi:hypothetical protein